MDINYINIISMPENAEINVITEINDSLKCLGPWDIVLLFLSAIGYHSTLKSGCLLMKYSSTSKSIYVLCFTYINTFNISKQILI